MRFHYAVKFPAYFFLQKSAVEIFHGTYSFQRSTAQRLCGSTLGTHARSSSKPLVRATDWMLTLDMFLMRTIALEAGAPGGSSRWHGQSQETPWRKTRPLFASHAALSNVSQFPPGTPVRAHTAIKNMQPTVNIKAQRPRWHASASIWIWSPSYDVHIDIFCVKVSIDHFKKMSISYFSPLYLHSLTVTYFQLL